MWANTSVPRHQIWKHSVKMGFFVCLCDVCCFIYLPWGQRTALDSNAFPGSEGRRQLPVRYAAWGVRAGMWPLFWPVWAYCAHYSGWKNRVAHGSDRCCCTVLKFKKFSHFKSCGLLNRKKNLLCGFRFGEMVKGCLRFSLGFINLLTQTCKMAFMVCPIPLLQTDKFELFKGSLLEISDAPV